MLRYDRQKDKIYFFFASKNEKHVDTLRLVPSKIHRATTPMCTGLQTTANCRQSFEAVLIIVHLVLTLVKGHRQEKLYVMSRCARTDIPLYTKRLQRQTWRQYFCLNFVARRMERIEESTEKKKQNEGKWVKLSDTKDRRAKFCSLYVNWCCLRFFLIVRTVNSGKSRSSPSWISQPEYNKTETVT